MWCGISLRIFCQTLGRYFAFTVQTSGSAGHRSRSVTSNPASRLHKHLAGRHRPRASGPQVEVAHPPLKGSGDGLCGSYHRAKEPITVTPAEIIYQRRIAVLDHADRAGNVAEACRVFGISRTRYYEWKSVADRYGLDALMPKARRAPQMPEATPTHVVEALLTLAVTQPTIGCRQYADRLGDQGFSIAKSTVQKHLVAHGLGKRAQRLARAAAIAAATTGLVTEAAARTSPSGSAWPRGVRASSSASTASTSASSRAWARCTSSPPSTSSPASPSWRSCSAPPNGAMTARFIHQALRLYRRPESGSRRCSPTTGPNTSPAPSRRPGGQGDQASAASRPARPTTTRCVSASRAPCSKSAGARPFIAGTSAPSASSRPKPTPGSSPTTAAGATTATTSRTYASRDPRQPQAKQGSMTTINRRAHLSPRLSVRKAYRVRDRQPCLLVLTGAITR